MYCMQFAMKKRLHEDNAMFDSTKTLEITLTCEVAAFSVISIISLPFVPTRILP